ncbi:MAG: hypothetical protein U0531_01735 [Dehalococcoidia bacterium]
MRRIENAAIGVHLEEHGGRPGRRDGRAFTRVRPARSPRRQLDSRAVRVQGMAALVLRRWTSPAPSR